MATSRLRRIIPDAILAAAILVLSVGLTTGAANARCPARSFVQQATSPDAGNAPAAQIARVAGSAIPIWKTVTVGTYKGVDAVRAATDAAPCPILVGDWADEILGRPAFPFGRVRTELDLVVVSVAELGFGDQGGSRRAIYARARAIGLELCPAEVGPVLRLDYLDQPVGEFLHLAMQPVARYGGELVDFTIGSGGAELMLIGGDADPEVILPGVVRLVFVRPRPDAISSTRPGTDASLAKR